jgi:hypothetical protein
MLIMKLIVDVDVTVGIIDVEAAVVILEVQN